MSPPRADRAGDEGRPDPDALLAEIGGEEERQGRGRLKVFLGSTAGVGKTYAMLEAGRERQAAGRDIVLGVVETHGRKETAALLEGLEILPRRATAHRGVTLEEFDLDGALERRPELLLVDELAHTNAPESRHEKRWQDVEELLDAGIDVYTTVNVQHLESLNDVVGKITQVRVQETVPDRLVEAADEVELIDLPPDELLRRLAEGKVYVPEQAERARQRFFRRGNLIALRQLALRYTAEHVDEDMRGYRLAHAIRETWPVAERLLVGVGPAPSSRNLVRATKRIADQLDAEWHAVFVETPDYAHWSQEDRQRVWETLRIARELGAETATLGGSGPSVLLDYARRENVTKIVVGKPHHATWRDRIFGSRLEEVIRGSGDVDVYVMSGLGEESEPARPPRPLPPRREPVDWVKALTTVGATAALAVFLRDRIALPNVIMLYLAAIVFVAARVGRRAALVASFVSVAAFDFFSVPPYNTFTITDTRYVPVFAFMLLVSLVVSTLTARLRSQAEASRHREGRTAALLDLSRELVPLEDSGAIAASVAKQLSALFEAPVRLFAADPFGQLRGLDSASRTAEPIAPGVAEWVRARGRPAGKGTATLPDAAALYVPVSAADQVLAVLEIGGDAGERFADPEQMQLLETFARHTAAALDRARLAVESRRAEHLVEVSRLKSQFVRVAARELTAPLARLVSDLHAFESGAATEARTEVAADLRRLRDLVGRLTDLSQLESGAIEIHPEPLDVAALVSDVIIDAGPDAKARGLELLADVPVDLPAASGDPVQARRALALFVEHAIAFATARVVVGADELPDRVQLTVADDGPAFAVHEQELAFEPFTSEGGRAGGAALGLAIARQIVRAHGGDVWVDSGPGPGAVFNLTLPRADRRGASAV